MNANFWNFIAILFGLYGLILLGAGIYYWLAGDISYATQFHPSIWWGGVLLLGSLVFHLVSRRPEKEAGK